MYILIMFVELFLDFVKIVSAHGLYCCHPFMRHVAHMYKVFRLYLSDVFTLTFRFHLVVVVIPMCSLRYRNSGMANRNRELLLMIVFIYCSQQRRQRLWIVSFGFYKIISCSLLDVCSIRLVFHNIVKNCTPHSF